MKAVIVAGGKGKRISELYPDIPKPLIEIGGKPVLEQEILLLKEEGISDFILTVHYMADKIMNYFGDGKRLGVSISYYVEKEMMGNAGALKYLKEELMEDFLLINADSVFSIDLEKMIQFHNDNGRIATIAAHPNNHPYDSGLLEVDKSNLVTKWHTKEEGNQTQYHNLVNAGIHILSPSVFKMLPNSDVIDLDRNILKPLVSKNEVVAYITPEYIKDMGTPQRLSQVREDWANGIIEVKNLKHKQKAIFIDRDGTLNKHVGFLKKEEEMELIAGVAEAINIIHSLGFLAIVITNQPQIARGELTLAGLDTIHIRLEALLGKENAYLDDIFFCPHHPDSGFEGEVKELKIECKCRKPKPGMIMMAAKKYNIDLSKSWMVGDEERDIKAGINAGCRTCLVGKEESFRQDISCSSLVDFARRLKEEIYS